MDEDDQLKNVNDDDFQMDKREVEGENVYGVENDQQQNTKNMQQQTGQKG